MIKKERLHIRFDDPDNGWIRIEIDFGENHFEESFSYAGYSGFSELISAITALWSGPCPRLSVTWLLEPTEMDFAFERAESQIVFEIIEYRDHRRELDLGKAVFQWHGSYEIICLAFWRALRSLEGRFSAEELTRRWHREWPATEMEYLTRMIRSSQHGTAPHMN